MASTHKGTCYCGAVQIETTGDPIDMGFCHCDGCRKYSGAPIAAFTLWKPEQVKITKGADSLGKFKSSDISVRPLLHEMRRARHGRSSNSRIGRHPRQSAGGSRIQTVSSPELRRHDSPSIRWFTQAERLPDRHRWQRSNNTRVKQDRIRKPRIQENPSPARTSWVPN